MLKFERKSCYAVRHIECCQTSAPELIRSFQRCQKSFSVVKGTIGASVRVRALAAKRTAVIFVISSANLDTCCPKVAGNAVFMPKYYVSSTPLEKPQCTSLAVQESPHSLSCRLPRAFGAHCGDIPNSASNPASEGV